MSLNTGVLKNRLIIFAIMQFFCSVDRSRSLAFVLRAITQGIGVRNAAIQVESVAAEVPFLTSFNFTAPNAQ
jgi:hypothetical protein